MNALCDIPITNRDPRWAGIMADIERDEDPRECEYAVLVTAAIGCVDITPWAARLGLDELLDDAHSRQGPDDFDYDRSKEDGAL